MKAREDVAAMLRAGATYAQIKTRLHASDGLISYTRRTLGIPLPPERVKRTAAEVAAIEDQAVARLRAGATHREIRREFRISPNRICQLRKLHSIPVPDHDRWAPLRVTVEQAFARYAQPTPEGGHLIWTGPRSGRGYDLIASGRTHNARHIAFRKHHGRDPEGQTRRTCDQTDCIAGAHLTDRTLREATP
ncbi:hypothetical protein PV437_42690 [Streptomyces scabiei]|uniref:hypothetical protein n=2 Tax=Streptomyces scabiei TaxID=1930 RepID=UPI0029B46582|nr:hypothetical protein [Streptomyces scabiei]MDX2539817.1 hypothetical protein [Streptomyces scabiei]